MWEKGLSDKQTENELTEKAKQLLMKNRGMTEQQAHKYLQKQAMDRCVRKSEIAEAVIADLTISSTARAVCLLPF